MQKKNFFLVGVTYQFKIYSTSKKSSDFFFFSWCWSFFCKLFKLLIIKNYNFNTFSFFFFQHHSCCEGFGNTIFCTVLWSFFFYGCKCHSFFVLLKVPKKKRLKCVQIMLYNFNLFNFFFFWYISFWLKLKILSFLGFFFFFTSNISFVDILLSQLNILAEQYICSFGFFFNNCSRKIEPLNNCVNERKKFFLLSISLDLFTNSNC